MTRDLCMSVLFLLLASTAMVAESASTSAGGLLDIELFGGFLPAPGDAFTIISAGAVEGEFRQVTGDLPGQGLHWEIFYSPTNVTLFATRDGITAIPEPVTMALLGLAACGLGGYVRRRQAA